MKKWFALLTATVLLVSVMGGCAFQTAAYAFNLLKQPIGDDVSLDLGKSHSVTAAFQVPADGNITFVGYDSTFMVGQEDGAEEYVEPTYTITLKDDKGMTLFAGNDLSDGRVYPIKQGTLVFTLTATGIAAKQELHVSLSWVYVRDDADAAPVTEEKTAAMADDKGVTRFPLTVEKPSLVKLFPAAACQGDYDCTFTVTDADGKAVAEDLTIHSNEWISRTVYLPAGAYTVTVSGISGMVTYRYEIMKTYAEEDLSADTVASLPALFGFTARTVGKRTVTFTPDADTKYLIVTVNGSDNYYDSTQIATVTVTDAKGNDVHEGEAEGEYWVDIDRYHYPLTVTVEAHNSCVAELTLSNSSYIINEFSYEDETADYIGEEPNVRRSGFKNTEKSTITTADDAVKLAKNEWDDGVGEEAYVGYDEKTKMWSVYLLDEGEFGFTVYMDEHGITKLCVSDQ